MAKEYPTLASHATDQSILFVKGDAARETTELVTKLNTCDKARRFGVSRVLKPEKDKFQYTLFNVTDANTSSL